MVKWQIQRASKIDADESMRSVPPAVAGGLTECGLLIAECGIPVTQIRSPQSTVRNVRDPPATAGGTDFIASGFAFTQPTIDLA